MKLSGSGGVVMKFCKPREPLPRPTHSHIIVAVVGVEQRNFEVDSTSNSANQSLRIYSQLWSRGSAARHDCVRTLRMGRRRCAPWISIKKRARQLHNWSYSKL
jgi:hypothetical protein